MSKKLAKRNNNQKPRSSIPEEIDNVSSNKNLILTDHNNHLR